MVHSTTHTNYAQIRTYFQIQDLRVVLRCLQILVTQHIAHVFQ